MLIVRFNRSLTMRNSRFDKIDIFMVFFLDKIEENKFKKGYITEGVLKIRLSS